MAITAGTAYIEIKGDFDPLNKEIDRTTSSSKSKFKTIGKAAALGVAGGLVALGAAAKASVDAAIESEKSQARMQTQLKALGISYKDHAGEIDRVIQKTSKLAGLDDEDLQDAFTNIVRTTGDVQKSLKLTGLAADFARAKHMDVAKAGEIVAKVAGGNTGILSRYGVQIDKGATSTEALGALQKKFAGQAKAYGDTTAGAQDRFRVAVENLQEKLGQFLLPIIAKVANALSTFVTGIENGTGAGGKFAGVIKSVGDAIKASVEFVKRYSDLFTALGAGVAAAVIAFGAYKVAMIAQAAATSAAAVAQGGLNAALLANPVGAVVVAIAALVAGVVLAYKESETFRTIVQKVWGAIKDAAEVAWTVVKGVIEGIIAYYTTVFEVGSKVVTALVDGVKAAAGAIAGAATWIKDKIVDGIQAYIGIYKTVGGWVINRIVEGVQAVAGFAADVGGWVKNRVEQGIKSFADAIGAVGGWITGKIVGGVKAVAGIANEIGEWVASKVSGAWSFITEAAGELGGKLIEKVVTGLKLFGFATEIGTWIVDKLKALVDAGGETGKKVIDAAAGLGKGIGDAIVGAVQIAFNGLKEILKSVLNRAIDLVNHAIKGFNKIPLAPNIPVLAKIDEFASGVRNAPGGWALVGENGPEIMNVPRGADVYPAGRTRQMLAPQLGPAPALAGALGDLHADIFIGGERIDERVDVRIERRDRAAAATFRAGVLA